jgi:hypothetical protein
VFVVLLFLWLGGPRVRRSRHDLCQTALFGGCSPAINFPVSHAPVTWVGWRVNANGAEEDLHVVGTKRWNCCCFLAQRYIYVHEYFNIRALLV